MSSHKTASLALALIVAFSLTQHRATAAVGYAQIHSFTGDPTSATFPYSKLIQGNDGALYGTALLGGSSGFGVVLKINTDGSGYSVLHSFSAIGGDGHYPIGNLIQANDSFLYGTTEHGGTLDLGTVFKISTDGTSYSILHSFSRNAMDGTSPFGGLIQGLDGSLYGTGGGGTSGSGTIFKINTDGSNFSIVHSFAGSPGDGASPVDGLIQGNDGMLYCTTESGGVSGYGTVFKVSTDGSTFSVLHSFTSAAGGQPQSPLIQGSDGFLYGTGFDGLGVVFKIGTDGNGYSVIHTFTGGNDAYPRAGLFQGSDSFLYGTTEGDPSSHGSVFKISTDGSVYSVIHSFAGGPGDGDLARGGIIQGNDGALYGTTLKGGASGNGIIFKLSTDGSVYSLLCSLPNNGGNGQNPNSRLIQGTDGALYGTCTGGGTANNGTVFKVSTDGNTYSVLHSFDGADGQAPYHGLIQGSDGSLYGTTLQGGASNRGVVFKLSTDGSVYSVLYSFSSSGNDGNYPYGGLVQGSDGLLYGTTELGGISNSGTVFKISTDGSAYAVLHSFNGGDGTSPLASLIQGLDGMLYGTTQRGGASNRGTIFKISTDGSVFSVLHSCTLNGGDGNTLYGELIQGSDGTLYGTTQHGGAPLNSGGPLYDGTAFKMRPDGSAFSLLHSFTVNTGDGMQPQAGLVLGGDGLLYGTTVSGGASGSGTVFKISTDGSVYSVLYSFSTSGGDGTAPVVGLMRGHNGSLYGATPSGGVFGFGSIFCYSLPGPAMTTARDEHTATLLSNGKLLTAGGIDSSGNTLASAELYDPVKNTWSATASLSAARNLHTATMLTNGEVLIAGGQNGIAFLSSSELYDPLSNTWSNAGSLNTARRFHTATLLNDGHVLVAGGQDSNGNPLTSAELYDPATATWSTVGGLTTARYAHSATLLPSGKVLVAGGTNGPNALADSELYDPGAKTWSLVGSLGTARYVHTATLLPNGTVLAAGGRDSNANPFASAELYNPGTNTWSTAGSLTNARFQHTATLIPNGKLLVIGGLGNASVVASAELYDPGTNTWSAANSLTTPRSQQTATLLSNGETIVVGGTDSSGNPLATAELYDAVSPTWSSAGSMVNSRVNHTATLLPSGKVLTVGGYNGAEVYDPAGNTWSSAGSFPISSQGHTATLLQNGLVLVAGGFPPSQVSHSSAELYDPASHSWSFTTNLTTARDSHTATLLPNGKVLVVGGEDGPGNALSSAELYDPSTNTWSPAGTLAAARYDHTATLLLNGKVLVAGGYANGVAYLNSAELYDPATNTWSAAASLTTARYNHSMTLLPNGKVLVAGGVNSTYLNTAELYDPASNSWSAAGSLTTARQNRYATLLPNGKVLIAAGYNNIDGYLNSAELYDPTQNSWSAAGNLTAARQGHTTTLLPNGMVLVSGGDTGGGPLSSAELYLSTSAVWNPAASMAGNRVGHAAILLTTGRVLVAGGQGRQGILSNTNLATAELYDSTTNSWTAAGNLTDARIFFTATLLPNGKVLVAGGQGNIAGQLLTSAELYDSNTNSWSSAGNLITGRDGHSATLLLNGKVLITGGQDGNGPLASAELYDPGTNAWSNAASLSTARAGSTATLLPNGRVLVTGGEDSNGPLASAELYDPGTNSWSAVASLATARYGHTASLLPDGILLVAGGSNGTTTLASSELYDPGANTWSAAGDLNTGRNGHRATLLPNGKILVEAGLGGSFPPGKLASAEVYDPATNAWSVVGSLATARQLHTATLLPTGNVLVVGGVGNGPNNGTILYSAELFNTGLQYQSAWQPSIGIYISPVVSGVKLYLVGTGFKGISEASGGSTNNSATNFPIVRLQSLVNEQVAFLSPDTLNPFSDTRFTSALLPNFPAGGALVTVFTNGIPSVSVVIIFLPHVLDHFEFTLAATQVDGQPIRGLNNVLIAQDAAGLTIADFDASVNNVTIYANPPLVGSISGLGAGNNGVLNRPGDFVGGIAFVDLLGMTYTGNATTGTFSAISADGKVGTSGSVTFTQQTQTINFTALSNKNYGDSAFALTATASSGLPVSYSVTSGPASVIGNTLAITGAGFVNVQASQTGDSVYSAAVPVSQSFNVNTAPLSITANNATKVFNTANPVFSATYSGFVNGDTASSLAGTLSLSTTSTTGSSVGVYPITPSGQSSNNYTITYSDGTLMIMPAAATITLSNLSTTFNATPQSATVTTSPVGLSTSVTYNGSGTPPTNAGSYTVIATITNSNYTGSTVSTLVIAKATPVITWANPASVVAGTPLSATQLNATANVPGVFSYVPPIGTLLAAGVNQTLTALFAPTDAANQNPASATVTISVTNAAPAFVSLPTATPNPALVGQLVVFVAIATDADSDALTYTWDFGDGLTGSGPATSHTYSLTGAYLAKVNVTDVASSSTSATINVTVNAIGGSGATPPGQVPSPFTISNANGIPDQMQNAASQMGIAAVSSPQTLPDVKLGIKLVFSKLGNDSISLSGTLVRPANFKTDGAAVIVDVGGVVTAFNLTSTGKIKNGSNSFNVAVKGNNTATAKFSMKLSKGAFAATLAAIGLDNADESAKAVTVPVGVIFSDQLCVANIAEAYSARKGKIGSTKSK